MKNNILKFKQNKNEKNAPGVVVCLSYCSFIWYTFLEYFGLSYLYALRHFQQQIAKNTLLYLQNLPNKDAILN